MRKPGAQPEPERLSSEPLLNEEQRAALDAALARKRVESNEPAPVLNGVPPALEPNPTKPHLGKNPFQGGMKTKRDIAHDHHLSRKTKGNGRTKKSGAGGRFTWGAVTDPTESARAADRGDPNWDSEEEEEALALAEDISTQIAAYKAAVSGILSEYFNSGDSDEAAMRLQELDHPQFGHYFVKKAVVAALDRHEREREMTSALLSTLYNEVISSEQMRRGFMDLVAALDDLVLDVPDAVDLVSTFACRAVADDVLPPAFIHKIDGQEGSTAALFRRTAEAHLADQHFAERMSRAWGHGAGGQLQETKSSITAMLDEYWTSDDVAEVHRLLHELAVPFFHHELVKQALVAGTSGSDRMKSAIHLLGQLASSGDVSISQMTKGFQRVADALQDTELDNPGACERFTTAITAAVDGGWLEEGWTPSPTPASTPGTPAASLNNANGPFHPSVQAFKAASRNIITEYFDSGDAKEVARRLTELDEPGFHNVFVKYVIAMSLDRRDRERELASALLPILCPGTTSPDQVALGFTRLLAGADDLALDVPDAAHMLTLFLGRAVVDEVIPPKFLAEVVPTLPAGALGESVVQAAGSMLSARHSAERFSTCWHARGPADSEALASAMSDLLREYLISEDLAEAARCLNDLGAPHFHHELVYQALVVGLADAEKEGPKAMALLRALTESGEISATQLRLGFDRVKSELDDLALDYLKAPELLPKYEEQAKAQGWL